MYRTDNCGELRVENVGEVVKLAGWVARLRKMGGMTFIDLRDRYGVTQLVVDDEGNSKLNSAVEQLGREYVIQAEGEVVERSSKNSKMATGDIEVKLSSIKILNSSETPPFTIEDQSDGGEELRAQYRYLDLRRSPLKRAMELRHKVGQKVRNYLDSIDFLEIETPMLIKSTPEGARDFIVPSRMNPGQFYALPQSPQTFKQLLMVAGFDRYFQIVRCFRDEDLRADRQPEFTQIDCELSFVNRDDVMTIFEGLIRYLFKEVLNITIEESFPRITYRDAMRYYGSDKPDIRFGMKISQLKCEGEGDEEGVDLVSGRDFPPFDSAQYVGALVVEGGASYTRREVDQLIDWVRRPQVGATGMVYIRVTEEGSNSSVNRFYSEEDRAAIVEKTGAKAGDIIFILAGERRATEIALGTLRVELGDRRGLREPTNFAPLWVYDFPLVEWDDETERFYAMHHPFTAPKEEELDKFYSNDREEIASISADAYDFVLNGTEIGGGSIRIHDAKIQQRMFEILGFSKEEAEEKFGFIIDAFKYGAPPHGGIAFGFDRLVAILGGEETIRDFIAFPKNTSGRDVMLDAPSAVDKEQLTELHLKSTMKR